MFAKILKGLRWVIGGALMLVGLLVVLLVWFLSGGEKKQPEKISVPLPVAAQVVESCDCSAGATCTGSRGGRYCLAPSGAKRYTEKQP